MYKNKPLKRFFNHSICIINGGPGTGKTTTVKGILALYNAFYPDSKVQLCAPTGRASKRLSQLAYADSKTIHSLLKWNKDDNTFAKDENDPLELDVLIIDEFSMVDTHLFCSLLKALPDHARILMIGDEDQLESVGPGKVFEDIISSQVFPVIHLGKNLSSKKMVPVSLPWLKKSARKIHVPMKMESTLLKKVHKGSCQRYKNSQRIWIWMIFKSYHRCTKGQPESMRSM